MADTHDYGEDDPWDIRYADHPGREETPAYRRSRILMNKLAREAQPFAFGPPPYQDHHGGGLWVKDGTGWLLLFAPFGIEWAAQFCADPAKVDAMRVFTQRVLAAFPDTLPGYQALGYRDADAVLGISITDAAGVAAWTDSIFNASVPLPPALHVGELPTAAGYHHYPKPIVDILSFKYDDFDLFVTDDDAQTVAVVPVKQRGANDGHVAVVWADPASRTGKALSAAHAEGRALILPPASPLATQAFARQPWAGG
jgi:hypothetical protein